MSVDTSVADCIAPDYDPGSYRDRDGRVVLSPGGRVFRGLSARALENWRSLESTEFLQKNLRNGRIVGTRLLATAEADAQGLPAGPWNGYLEHDRIPLISYPYEWTFGMLRDAALLQLELLEAALRAGFTIKDGTAYNVQWLGCQPTFIDVASFEPWSPGTPWNGYRQFCQTCLLPLFLQAYKQVAFQPWLRGRLDGVPPDEFNRLCTWRDLLRPGVLVHGCFHAHLQGSRSISDSDVRRSLEHHGLKSQMVRNTAASLRKLVAGLRWRLPRSTWSDYAPAYDDADWQLKQRFVREALHEVGPRNVWDLGCNTGTFSRIAAETAPFVLAIDGDHPAVEKLYQALRAEPGSQAARCILPLVGDIVDASPDLGWRGRERRSLPQRGRPQLVLALALVHHVVLSAGVPLAEFIDWLASLGGAVVLEFVSKDDPQARRVLRNRRDDDPGYTLEACEHALRARFGSVRCTPLGCGTRTLFLARPR